MGAAEAGGPHPREEMRNPLPCPGEHGESDAGLIEVIAIARVLIEHGVGQLERDIPVIAKRRVIRSTHADLRDPGIDALSQDLVVVSCARIPHIESREDHFRRQHVAEEHDSLIYDAFPGLAFIKTNKIAQDFQLVPSAECPVVRRKCMDRVNSAQHQKPAAHLRAEHTFPERHSND
jgi:hypothetical protein